MQDAIGRTNSRSHWASAAGLCLASLLVVGCTPSDLESGKVLCGAGPTPCPNGYYCASDNKCWRDHTGPDAGTAHADGSIPDTSDAKDSVSDGYVDRGGQLETGSPVETGGTIPDTHPDLPTVADTADAPPVGTPDLPPDLPFADVPSPADTPIAHDVPVETSTDLPASSGCPSGKTSCGDKCIDPAPAGCCSASDCSGSCMTCGANNTCVPLRNQDDPSGRCAGTCDANGDCRGKRGQTCQSVGGACASGLFCSPENLCCDKQCTGSCEACNVKGSEGTCTTLPANESPHGGHGPCTGDGVCAGYCGGSSATCTFPTAACGTAECKSDGFHGAGACKSGACVLPSVQVCANACDASAGCTGVCKPDALQCNPQTDVPQKCTATGGWKDQTACSGGYKCSQGACDCPSPKSICDQACIDTSSDAKNCGTCKHDCLGGTCSSGKCQPVAVASSLGSNVRLMGIDSQSLYYAMPSATASFAYQVGKTPGSQPVLGCEAVPRVSFLSVIGNYVLDSPGYLVYAGTIGATGTCENGGNTAVSDNGNDRLVPWGSTQPNLFGMANTSPDGGYGVEITWYQAGGTNSSPPRFYGISNTDSSLAYRSFFQFGTIVYMIRDRHDDTANKDLHDLVYVNYAGSTYAETDRTASLTGTMKIIDVNAQSVLLWDAPSTDGIFSRVATSGTSARQTIATLSPAPTDGIVATEDATGLYWFDTAGKLNRCPTSATAGCAETPTALLTGQHASGFLYQDDQALYWADPSQGAIMKLAK
jgi:hypothetical protein